LATCYDLVIFTFKFIWIQNSATSLSSPPGSTTQWRVKWPSTGGSHLLILATQEAEIRRIMVQSQSRLIVCETLSWKTLYKNRAGGVAQGEGWVQALVPQKKKSEMDLVPLPHGLNIAAQQWEQVWWPDANKAMAVPTL
jgi:hypothetical protein